LFLLMIHTLPFIMRRILLITTAITTSTSRSSTSAICVRNHCWCYHDGVNGVNGVLALDDTTNKSSSTNAIGTSNRYHARSISNRFSG
jgi:hypothetical protein